MSEIVKLVLSFFINQLCSFPLHNLLLLWRIMCSVPGDNSASLLPSFKFRNADLNAAPEISRSAVQSATIERFVLIYPYEGSIEFETVLKWCVKRWCDGLLYVFSDGVDRIYIGIGHIAEDEYGIDTTWSLLFQGLREAPFASILAHQNDSWRVW